MTPVDPSKAATVLAAIEKKFGAGTLVTGDQYTAVPRISTGSIELDYATGGGIPIGRWTRLWGGYSSGKSLTCWQTIREAQKLGLGCVYYNAEKQFDPAFTAAVGVDVSKLHVVNGSTIEHIGEQLEALIGVYHLHVIDSASQCVSLEEQNADVAAWSMGLNARVWSKVIRRVSEKFDDKENVAVIVDQARDSFGFGGGENPPGGRLMEHNSSLTIYFRRGGWLFYDDNGVLVDKGGAKQNTLSGRAEADGVEFVARVNKSRVCRPLRSATMRYDIGQKAFDRVYEYVQAAIASGYAHSYAPGRYELPDGTKIHGMKDLRAKVADADVQKAIYERTMRMP